VSIQQTRDRLAEVLTDPLSAAGLDLEAVELTAAGKRRILRVAVDQDGGVTLDDIAAATREVSRVLDESDVMGSTPYTLEVSSPGIDRPLVLPRHWRRNKGRLVKATLTDGRVVTGRVSDADDRRAVLEVEVGSGPPSNRPRATSTEPQVEHQEVAFDEVAKAKVQIEFNRKES
jgi:ribosome maturation factor RimP